MRIAIIGTRGIPAAYGGFETFAEELGTRLVERGHDVTVYSRSHFTAPGTDTHRGVKIRVLPTIRHKYLDTVVHTALSSLDALVRGFDSVLLCNVANAPFALVPRLVGTKVALNVDGLEWNRKKWGHLGRVWYKACFWLAVRLPVTLISDAEVVARFYAQRRRGTRFIPYGTDGRRLPAGRVVEDLGAAPGRYVLYVSRLEPENNALTVLRAYRASGIPWPLVMVGDAPYASEYRRRLHEEAADIPGVRLTGYVFGDGYVELQSNAGIYVQATEVGGTHPALVEAMGRGACVLANDVPEHREVLGEAGAYYQRNDVADLAEQLRRLVDDDVGRSRLGAAAAGRARSRYSWDSVTDQYEALFRALTAKRRR